MEGLKFYNVFCISSVFYKLLRDNESLNFASSATVWQLLLRVNGVYAFAESKKVGVKTEAHLIQI